MQQLEFSSKEIVFEYEPKGHLKAAINLTNITNEVIYFKFKLTRPKYYLLKPDRGFLEPKQTIKIDITLHSQGVNDAESDKAKCFYRSVGKTHEEPSAGWERQDLQTYNVRLQIFVNGLPEQLRKEGEQMKYSQVKSLAQSKFDCKHSTPSIIESKIKEKQGNANLHYQIDSLRKHEKPQTTSFSWEYAAAGVVGLFLGLISSYWI